jgi:putative endonuclease
MEKQYYIYILTNATHRTLYTGVTNDLKRRVWEHKGRFVEGFTKRYYVDMLVYYEVCEDIMSAIAREKQIKGGSRAMFRAAPAVGDAHRWTSVVPF